MINTIRVLVSRKCNFNCSYCCNEIEEVQKTISQTSLSGLRNRFALGESIIKNVVITGGEPFLSCNWETTLQLVEMLKEFSFNVYIYTNGTPLYIVERVQLISNILLDKFKGVNILYHVKYDSWFYYISFRDINSIVPVRLQIEQNIYEMNMHFITDMLLVNKCITSVKTFNLGDCTRKNEILFEVEDETETV